MIDWGKGTKEDHEQALKIVARASQLGDTLCPTEKMSLEMDLIAVHCNDVQLDWEKLLSFDDGSFGHDVFGIRRYIDRDTGKLTDCFLPRCAS